MKSTPELLTRLSANPWFGALPMRERRAMLAASERVRLNDGEMPVSYTHLTLPTIYSV